MSNLIANVRRDHRRVECGPGIPGCGPDCEGGPDGTPLAFCPICGVWPCLPGTLLAEIDRLTAELADARKARTPTGWGV